MRTIKAYDDRTCWLSDEIYEVLTNQHPSPGYKKGAIVHLISDRKDVAPGKHPDRDYRVVCRIEAKTAEFCGIEVKALRLISETRLRELYTEARKKLEGVLTAV